MISYHPDKADPKFPSYYAKGFKTADTNDIERLKNGLTSHVWSPCVWQDGVRLEKNFLRADWCVLDFDTPEMSLAEACEIFVDRIHIIGTTKSHQRNKGGIICDRYRVAFLFDQPIVDLKTYRYNMWKFTKKYPCDSKCKDGARYFFPCGEIVQSDRDGYTEEVQEAPENEITTHGRIATGGIPPWTLEALNKIIPTGERNTTCYRIAKDLAALGCTPDRIMSVIINSKTYRGAVSETLLKEIHALIESASKKVAAETLAERS